MPLLERVIRHLSVPADEVGRLPLLSGEFVNLKANAREELNEVGGIAMMACRC